MSLRYAAPRPTGSASKAPPPQATRGRMGTLLPRPPPAGKRGAVAALPGIAIAPALHSSKSPRLLPRRRRQVQGPALLQPGGRRLARRFHWPRGRVVGHDSRSRAKTPTRSACSTMPSATRSWARTRRCHRRSPRSRRHALLARVTRCAALRTEAHSLKYRLSDYMAHGGAPCGADFRWRRPGP